MIKNGLMEVWKPIDFSRFPDYKISKHGCLAEVLKGYEASNLGRIRNPNQEIKPQTQRKDGYKIISVLLGSRHRSILVHRLVAIAFLAIPSNLKIIHSYNYIDGIPYLINHIDNDPSNNEVSNLEWCDSKHNMNHAYDNHRNSRGLIIDAYDHITNEIIRFRSTRELGRFLGTSQSTASGLAAKCANVRYKGRYTFNVIYPDKHMLYRQLKDIKVVIENVCTKNIVVVDNIVEASKLTGIRMTVIHHRLTKDNQWGISTKGYCFYDYDKYMCRIADNN